MKKQTQHRIPTADDEKRLLPCPFCGSSDVRLFRGMTVPTQRDIGHRFATCRSCHVSGPYSHFEDAITHWNTRKPPSVIVKGEEATNDI